MKYASLLALSLMFGTTSFAKKTEQDMKDATKKEWKNPITGTKHVTEKEKQKVKGPHGEAEVDVTKKTAIEKNGKVKEKLDVEGESTTEPTK